MTKYMDIDVERAWAIVNSLKDGTLSDAARNYIAGQITGVLVKVREEAEMIARADALGLRVRDNPTHADIEAVKRFLFGVNQKEDDNGKQRS